MTDFEGQVIGPGDVSPPAPPFVLETTRMAAIDHIERYEKVYSRTASGEGSHSSTAIVHGRNHGVASEEDVFVLRQIVQAKLTVDLKQLIRSVLKLEGLLLANRYRVWVFQGLIAAGPHLVLRSGVIERYFQHRPKFSFPPWMFLAYYPIALYRIVKFEISISSTISAREAFERLLRHVREERPLRQPDLDYVTGARWDAVPWKELPDSVYH